MDGVADFHRRAALFGAMLMAGFALLMILSPKPKLPPISALNGVYSNPCCSPVRLLNGWVIVNGKSRAFKIGYDKSDLYLLPEKYLGVIDGNRIEFGNGFPLKLRVDDAQRPTSIQLWDVASSTTYDFQLHKRPLNTAVKTQ